MARRHNDRKAPRDNTTPISNGPGTLRRFLDPVRPLPAVRVTPSSVDLRRIEDRRLYHPDRVRSVVDLDNRPHRLVAPGAKRRFVHSVVRRPVVRKSYGVSGLFAPAVALPSPDIGVFNRRKSAFLNAGRMLVCLRRAIRKEVMFAKRKAGRGSRQRKPRYNEFSNIRCR